MSRIFTFTSQNGPPSTSEWGSFGFAPAFGGLPSREQAGFEIKVGDQTDNTREIRKTFKVQDPYGRQCDMNHVVGQRVGKDGSVYHFEMSVLERRDKGRHSGPPHAINETLAGKPSGEAQGMRFTDESLAQAVSREAFAGWDKDLPYAGRDEALPYAGRDEALPYAGRDEAVPYAGAVNPLAVEAVKAGMLFEGAQNPWVSDEDLARAVAYLEAGGNHPGQTRAALKGGPVLKGRGPPIPERVRDSEGAVVARDEALPYAGRDEALPYAGAVNPLAVEAVKARKHLGGPQDPRDPRISDEDLARAVSYLEAGGDHAGQTRAALEGGPVLRGRGPPVPGRVRFATEIHRDPEGAVIARAQVSSEPQEQGRQDDEDGEDAVVARARARREARKLERALERAQRTMKRLAVTGTAE